MRKKILNLSFNKIIFIVIILAIIISIWYLAITLFSKDSKFSKNEEIIGDYKTVEKPYTIAYQGDKNDTSGRTILANGQRVEGLLEDKFYWSWEHNTELNLIGYTQAIGVFRQWEAIKDSKDLYLKLVNPDAKTKDKIEFHVRVILDRKEGSEFIPTKLSVQNLDYGYSNNSVSPTVPLGYIANLSQQEINTLIKPGDVITVYPVFLDIETAKKQRTLNQKDENGYFVAKKILIRRFGGKETILKELE